MKDRGREARHDEARLGYRCFVALIPGFLYTSVEGTLVNIALPSIEHGLALSVGLVGWIPLAWLLSTGSLSPLAGVIADRIGRRRTYFSGLVIVTLGSVWAAFSPTGTSLIVARVLQGIGAAAIVANGLAIIAEQFVPSEQARAVGRMTAIVAAGSVVAPVAGGAMAEFLGWRSVFWLEAGGGLAGAVFVWRRLPPDGAAASRWWQTLPWATATALVFSATALLLGLWGIGAWGLTSRRTVLAFLLAAVVGGYGWVRNGRISSRLIRWDQVPSRTAWTLASLGAGNGVLAGLSFMLPLYLAHVHAVRGLRLGLEVLPFAVGLVVGALVGGRIGALRGPPAAIGGGLVLGAVGLAAYDGLTAWAGVGALGIAGVGLGAFSVGANAEILHGPGAGIGTVTGLAGLVRRVGQVGGVAAATIVLQTAGPEVGVGWLSAGAAVALVLSLPAFRAT